MEKALAKRRSNLVPVEPSAPALTPMTILANAIEKGVDIDQLEKLMGMVERWEKNQARKSFFKALASFQAMCPVIKKNKTAQIKSEKGSYSYKYAELGNIEVQIKSAMEQCGLTKRWEYGEEGGQQKVSCLITHIDGHTETTEMKADKDNSGGKNAIQQKGSANTYMERYTLLGGLGIVAAEDNDGRGAKTTPEPQPEPTEEEVLAQWQQSVDGVSTRAALKSLYLSNRKAVDGNDKIKAIFKTREDQLPATPKTELP